jgi:hypothetical protein
MICGLKEELSLSEDRFVAGEKNRLNPPQKGASMSRFHFARVPVACYSLLAHAAWEAPVGQ